MFFPFFARPSKLYNIVQLLPQFNKKCSFSAVANQRPTERSFRYTLPNNKLTLEQRQFYEENGYLIVPKLVPTNILDACQERFVELCSGKIAGNNGVTLVKDISLHKAGITGEKLYYKIQDFAADDVLFQFSHLPQILEYVESITGPNILSLNTMILNKPPDSMTTRHPLHQDMYYFLHRPEDRIVAAWTAMERIDRENGCLFLLPGTHKDKIREHSYPESKNGVNKLYYGIRGFDEHPRIDFIAEKGDTIFFHPLLMHGSGANQSKTRFRKAISTHFVCAEMKWVDAKGTLSESADEEFKHVYNLNLQEYFYRRLHYIKGEKLPIPLPKSSDGN